MKIHFADLAMSTTTCSNSFTKKKSFLLGCIVATMLSPWPSSAGEGPALGSGIGAPDARGTEPTIYGLKEGLNCPVITFGAGVFAGNGNQWGNHDFAPYNSTNAGGTNVGGVAGISIPLGGSLAQYCRKQAELQLMRTKLDSLLEDRNAAVTFLSQCDWIQTYYPGYKGKVDKQANTTADMSLLASSAFELFKDCPDKSLRTAGRIASKEDDGKGKDATGQSSKTTQPSPEQMTDPPLLRPQPPRTPVIVEPR